MKRIFSFLFALCFAFGAPTQAAFAQSLPPKVGLHFDSYPMREGSTLHYGMDSYQSEKKLEQLPHTFEAWVYADRFWEGGTILGNYSQKSGERFTFTLNERLFPELTFYGKNGVTHSAVFKKAGVPTEQWIQMVIVFDEEAEEFRCYINGEIRQTIAFEKTCGKKCENGCAGIFSAAACARYPFMVGGDFDYVNPDYFRGYMQDVALYADVRTDEEIAEKYQNGAPAADEDLILLYDLGAADHGKDIADESSNGYHLFYSKAWMTEEEMEAERESEGFCEEYDYAIAVLGDPQYATNRNPEAVRATYEWLAENKEAKNIQHLIILGDLTDQCQKKEWDEASDALKILENADLSYSLVRGNHDTALSGIDSSSKATATPEAFDLLFAAEDSYYLQGILSHGGLYEEGSVKNTYRTLDCEGEPWLILNLDWRVDDAVFAWAREVIESHPAHRTVIVTHEYLGATAQRTANGGKIWESLASQYENVVLVLGGHISWDNILVNQDEGVHGNTVTQMLIDPQRVDYHLAGVGLVTMFYFCKGESTVDIEHYSPIRDRYYKNINQMRMDLKPERLPEAPRKDLLWRIAVPAAAVCAAGVGAFAFFLVKKRKAKQKGEAGE